MGRMSDLHIELTVQANELGFESVQEAIDNGYLVDYKSRQLMLDEDGIRQASNEWELEKLKGGLNGKR